jgi:Zn-dependent peptidase ImmA (M78 family)
MPVRRKFIREVVERLLDEHAIKQAPVHAEHIAKRLKIDVKFEEAEDDLSGFLFRDPTSNKAIIGVNASHHENRKRFTLAHELGHFILHEGQTVHIDENPKKLPFRINLRDEESAKGSDDDEKEANLFAAELLMPAKFLERDLKGKDIDLLEEGQLSDLATKYKVSIQALSFRLANLGYREL